MKPPLKRVEGPVPVAAPGEVYNEAMIDYLQEIVAAGGYVEGASDQSLDQLRVVVNPH